MLILCGS
jgi:AAA+ ATPase superfamily predicted ATPase